jgi:hypothetical protein
MNRRLRLIALLMVVVAAAGAAWVFAAMRPASPATNALLEIRWHGNGIVLQGAVRDAATQQVLVEGATARLGGEANQVVDWLDIAPAALPVADAASLASLIRLGQEGWHLQRHATEAWLAMQSPHDDRGAQARQLLQRAFGPDAKVSVIPLS